MSSSIPSGQRAVSSYRLSRRVLNTSCFARSETDRNPFLGPGVQALLCSLIALGFSSNASAQNRYHVTWLAETLGNLEAGSAFDIDNTGAAAGHVDSTAFRWQPNGGLQLLGDLPGGAADSWAWAINAQGDVAGQSATDLGLRAFLWTAEGGMQSLGTLPNLPGTRHSQARDLNDQRLVVGQSETPTGSRAFLWREGAGMRDLGVLSGDTSSDATAINSNSQVVGLSNSPGGAVSRAFLWSEQGGMIDLGSLGSSYHSSAANDINDAGEVVGYSRSVSNSRAFVWTASAGMRALGVPPGNFDSSSANGINSLGQIVGTGRTYSSPTVHGFVWTPERGIQNLNSMLDAESAAWTINEARAINDRGQIVGEARRPGILTVQPVLLTPVSEAPIIAFTEFNEPPLEADSFTPTGTHRELGFRTVTTPSGGAAPLVDVVELGDYGRRGLVHRGVHATTTFDAVALDQFTGVTVALRIRVSDATFLQGDFVRASITDGSNTLVLADLTGANNYDELDILGDQDAGFLNYDAPIPGTWQQVSLIVESSSRDFSQRFDFDSVEIRGTRVVPEPASLLLAISGAVLLFTRQQIIKRVLFMRPSILAVVPAALIVGVAGIVRGQNPTGEIVVDSNAANANYVLLANRNSEIFTIFRTAGSGTNRLLFYLNGSVSQINSSGTNFVSPSFSNYGMTALDFRTSPWIYVATPNGQLNQVFRAGTSASGPLINDSGTVGFLARATTQTGLNEAYLQFPQQPLLALPDLGEREQREQPQLDELGRLISVHNFTNPSRTELRRYSPTLGSWENLTPSLPGEIVDTSNYLVSGSSKPALDGDFVFATVAPSGSPRYLYRYDDQTRTPTRIMTLTSTVGTLSVSPQFADNGALLVWGDNFNGTFRDRRAILQNPNGTILNLQTLLPPGESFLGAPHMPVMSYRGDVWMSSRDTASGLFSYYFFHDNQLDTVFANTAVAISYPALTNTRELYFWQQNGSTYDLARVALVPEPSSYLLLLTAIACFFLQCQHAAITRVLKSLGKRCSLSIRLTSTSYCICATVAFALAGKRDANAADDFRIVARSGQPAPGAMPGATFEGGAAMSPAINRHGQVAFTATLDGPGTEVFSAGLWVETESGLQNVALGGQSGPGLPSTLVMGSFERLGLSDDGRIGFVSGLFGTPGEIDDAFWIGAPGNLRLVAATKTQIVGPNGTLEIATSQPDPIRQWRELRDGTVVFEAAVRLVGNPAIGGVFREANGEITPVALAGTPAPGLSPGVSLVNPLLLGVNALGEITYTATLEGTGINTENNRGVWTIDDSGAQLLWRTGSPAPGLPGTTVNRLASTLALDDAGRGILAARFTGPGVTSNRDTALWFGTPENMQLVAREGDHPPGSPGDMNFEDLSDVLRQQIYTPSMSTNGHVAFAAVVGGTGISFPNDETLWLWRDGEFTLLAREGDAAAGVSEGIVFSSFHRGPTVNAHGQVVFSAMLRGDGITGANDTGIWATDRDGHLHLIAREGSQLNLPGGELATVSRFELPALSSVASPFSGAFNDRGEIVLYAVFTDAPGAFLVSKIVAVPEPRAYTLLALGVPIVFGCRSFRCPKNRKRRGRHVVI